MIAARLRMHLVAALALLLAALSAAAQTTPYPKGPVRRFRSLCKART